MGFYKEAATLTLISMAWRKAAVSATMKILQFYAKPSMCCNYKTASNTSLFNLYLQKDQCTIYSVTNKPRSRGQGYLMFDPAIMSTLGHTKWQIYGFPSCTSFGTNKFPISLRMCSHSQRSVYHYLTYLRKADINAWRQSIGCDIEHYCKANIQYDLCISHETPFALVCKNNTLISNTAATHTWRHVPQDC